jgi:hypothetical protein
MILHKFMEEEANVFVDEDEHMTIIACLLQLQGESNQGARFF